MAVGLIASLSSSTYDDHRDSGMPTEVYLKLIRVLFRDVSRDIRWHYSERLQSGFAPTVGQGHVGSAV